MKKNPSQSPAPSLRGCRAVALADMFGTTMLRPLPRDAASPLLPMICTVQNCRCRRFVDADSI